MQYDSRWYELRSYLEAKDINLAGQWLKNNAGLLLDEGENGSEAVIAAVSWGIPEWVRLVLQAGADPDTQVENWVRAGCRSYNVPMTALGYALWDGNELVIAELLAGGANPSLGRCWIEYEHYDWPVVPSMPMAVPAWNYLNRDSCNATWTGNRPTLERTLAILDLLYTHGADPNEEYTDDQGLCYNKLWWEARGDPELMQWMLDHGVRPE